MIWKFLWNYCPVNRLDPPADVMLCMDDHHTQYAVVDIKGLTIAQIEAVAARLEHGVLERVAAQDQQTFHPVA
jgi:hypothetical protein